MFTFFFFFLKFILLSHLQIKNLKSKVTQNNKVIDGKDQELKKLHTSLEEEAKEKQSLEQKLQELHETIEQEKTKAENALQQVSSIGFIYVYICSCVAGLFSMQFGLSKAVILHETPIHGSEF